MTTVLELERLLGAMTSEGLAKTLVMYIEENRQLKANLSLLTKQAATLSGLIEAQGDRLSGIEILLDELLDWKRAAIDNGLDPLFEKLLAEDCTVMDETTLTGSEYFERKLMPNGNKIIRLFDGERRAGEFTD